MQREKVKNKRLEHIENVMNNGITLIALVITIIVLLILAGVTIAMLTGDNGILKKAIESKEQTEIEEEKEAIGIAYNGVKIDNEGKDVGATDLQEELRNNGYNATVTDNGDESFLIDIVDTNRMYYVDTTGEVIEESKMLKLGTSEELKSFRDSVNKGNTYENWYVYLTNDISLNIDEKWNPIGVYSNDSTSPTSENNIAFKGIFNGAGYTINGVYIESTEKVKGLFAFIDNAIIKNLNLGNNCNIIGSVATAGIVGYAYNGSNINNCSNYSNITGASQSAGGIVGVLNNSNVNNCYNLGRIEADINVGGIAGYVTSNSKISQSYNLGIINGKEYYVGGIAGYTYKGSIINSCYNKGNVGADKIVGGITGYIRENASIKNCYNIGNISGNSNASGIVGHVNVGTIYNCYYLENTVNYSNDVISRDGIIHLTDAELKNIGLSLGDSFKLDLENKNNGYPILNWQ